MANAQRADNLKKAIEYAREHNKAVTIYQDPETGLFGFVEYDIGISLGYPLMEVISPFVRAAS